MNKTHGLGSRKQKRFEGIRLIVYNITNGRNKQINRNIPLGELKKEFEVLILCQPRGFLWPEGRGGMSWQLRDALLKLKEGRVIIPIDEDEDWVFTNVNGDLLDPDNWRRRVFSKALKKAGVRRIRIHDLRHTYATLRLSKGDNIIDVANQLGDDVTTVLKVYAHWMPGKKKHEVDELDTLGDETSSDSVKANEK